jgi:photosystem II stability/assembly factor-like uncharacterized protein
LILLFLHMSVTPRYVALMCSALILVGQGCTGSAQQAKGPDGGVYKTADRGALWAQKRVLIEGPKGVSIADDVITTLAFDPQDHKTIYAGTASRGLLMSLDGGDSWQPAGALNKGRIDAMAVDAKDKCTVFASQANKIFKTITCGRDWAQVWFDPKTEKVFTQLAVDWFNPTIVYAGTSEGDILKSTDAGINWLISKRADAPVTSIAIHPKDSRVIYVGTRGDGIWKTMDAGRTWQSIEKQLSEFDNARRVTQLALDPLQPETVYHVSKYGVLVSADGGTTWKAMALTSQPNTVDIRSFAVNPRNPKELQYVTGNTIMFSSDSGVTWVAKKLPSTRPANVVVTDPQDGNILYIGMGPLPKK